MRAPLAAAVAMAVGLIIMLGYFLPLPMLQALRAVLLDWAVSLVGIAALIGVLHLAWTHWQKLTGGRKKSFYSLFFLLAFLATAGAGLWLGPGNADFQQAVSTFMVPVESSLLALLAVVLAFTSLRLLQRRRDVMTILFVFSAALFMLLSSGLLAAGSESLAIGFILGVFNRLPQAGARGILIGIALGSLVTALRVLIGADRPYRG